MRPERTARRRWFRGSALVGLAVWLAITSPLVGADQAAEKASEAAARSQPPIELADVVVDGRLVMTGARHGLVSGRTACRRDQAEHHRRGPRRPDRADSVTVRVEDDRIVLLAGDRPLLDLFDADAEVERLPIDLLAEGSQARIQEIIAAYRHDRSSEVLLKKAAYGLAAVLLAAVLIVVFAKASRALANLLDRRLQQQIKTLEEKSARLIRSRNLTTVLRGLTKLVFLGLVGLTLYVSTQFVLGLFPWTRELADWLFGLILNPLTDIGLGLLGVIPDLIRLAILFVITRYLLRTIRTFFRGVDNGSIKLASFDRDLALPTYRLVRLVDHPVRDRHGLPVHSGFRLRGLQGALGPGRFDHLAGLPVRHRQHHRRLQPALPAPVQDRRPYQARRYGRHRDRASGTDHATAIAEERGDRDPEHDRPQWRGRQLLDAGPGTGVDPAHHGRHRLRDALAPGGGHAEGGGRPHQRSAGQAQALRPAKGARATSP
jgi:hypothetical protein